jgi:hypothetical protein
LIKLFQLIKKSSRKRRNILREWMQEEWREQVQILEERVEEEKTE